MRSSPGDRPSVAVLRAPTDESLRATRQERLDRTNLLSFFGLLPAIPTALLAAWILRGAVSDRRLMAWTMTLSVLTLVAAATSGLHVLLRRRGASTRWLERIEIVPLTAVAVAWGAAPLILRVPVDRGDLFMVLLLFALSAASVNIVLNAAVRPYFIAFQSTMIALLVLGLLASDQAVRIPMAIAAIAYLALTSMLHNVVFHSVVDAMFLGRTLAETNTELTRANSALSDRAAADALTGLGNRIALLDLLNDELGSGTDVALVYLDLDRFKIVNDSLGHAAGDELLCTIADRLRRLVRAGDLPVRLGGDEFCVLLQNDGDHRATRSFAQRIIDSISEPMWIEGHELAVNASAGVAVARRGDTAADMLRHADAAMYQAKEAGRNRVQMFDHRLRSSLAQRMDEEQSLRRAIIDGEIMPWYQPEIDLQTGSIVGAEVLARWERPDGVVVPAAAFVPLAEESGLVEMMNDHLFRLALAQRAAWHRRGMDPSFRIRINMSSRELSRPGQAMRLETLLRLSGCPAHGVSLEVTESSVITDLDLAALQLADIRRSGISIALDDFGTGYSSLSLLRALPLDGVKIDQSFIVDLTREPRDRALVSAVVGLARELGLVVTAEGVESHAQAAVLREMGCPRAQGYLWSAAVPSPELWAKVRQQSHHDAARRERSGRQLHGAEGNGDGRGDLGVEPAVHPPILTAFGSNDQDARPT